MEKRVGNYWMCHMLCDVCCVLCVVGCGLRVWGGEMEMGSGFRV